MDFFLLLPECALAAMILMFFAATLAKPHAADPTVATLLPPDLLSSTEWDPIRFTHLCEQVIDSGGPLETLCREIQRREWDLLFAFCYRKATAV